MDQQSLKNYWITDCLENLCRVPCNLGRLTGFIT